MTGITINGEYTLYTDSYWPRMEENGVFFSVFQEQDGIVNQLSEGVTFSSSNENVLWITSDGCEMKTGSTTGEVTITASYQGKAVASLTYQVKKNEGEGPVDTDPVPGKYAFLSYSSTSAIPGEKIIHLGSRLPFGNFQVSPSDAGGNSVGDAVSAEYVTFSSDNASVLYVDQEGGYIEGMAPGTANLIATVHDAEGKELGKASLEYTVPGYDSLIDQSTVYHEPLPDVSEDGLDAAYGRMGVSGIRYDLGFGLGSCRLNLYVPDRINDAAFNVAYTGLTVTSSDDSVVRASIDKQKGLALLEFVGSGAAEVKIVGNFTIDGVAATTTRTVTVTVTGALPGGGEQGGGQGGQTTEEQPTDEQKPTDSTDKKDTDGKDQDAQNQDSDDALPETGDPALLAVGMSGLAGAGTLGVAAVLRRRPR